MSTPPRNDPPRKKALNEAPLLAELRDLPRRYMLPGGRLDSAMIRADLGLGDEAALKDALLALYRLDMTVAHIVDQRLVRALMARLVGDPAPLIEVPPEEESAWFEAERACEACPGSEIRPAFPGGPELPVCLSSERVERWESCRQFRERLFAAAADGRARHEDSMALARINGMQTEFEQKLADYERAVDGAARTVSTASDADLPDAVAGEAAADEVA